MQQNLKVSVCMITYGHEKYIRDAIEGVLMQECDFEVELILANDCSPDSTDKVIQDILENHPRKSWIKYFKHEKNLGMMPNFIFAMQECQGKYIALCEGDDYWTDPLKLQKQVDFLEANPDYVVCYHDCAVIDGLNNLKIKSLLGNYKSDYNGVDLKKGAWLPTLTRCFRNVVNEYPPFFKDLNCGDLFLTSILGAYGKAKYLDFNGATYREHTGGAWSGTSEKLKAKKMIFDYINLYKYYKDKDEDVCQFYENSLYKSFVKDFKLNIEMGNIVYNLKNYRYDYVFFIFKSSTNKLKKKFWLK
jgi:glycosyltransferase involved in cell wall biosynthesis